MLNKPPIISVPGNQQPTNCNMTNVIEQQMTRNHYQPIFNVRSKFEKNLTIKSVGLHRYTYTTTTCVLGLQTRL